MSSRPPSPTPSLSPSEWLVVLALRGGCSTPAEIISCLPSTDLSENTVSVLLRRLSSHGLVEGDGQTWMIEPPVYTDLLGAHIERFVDCFVLSAVDGPRILETVLEKRGFRLVNLG